MKPSFVFHFLGLILALTTTAAFGQAEKPPAARADAAYTVGIHNLRVHLSDRGEIVGMDVGDKLTPVTATANTWIGECRDAGQTTSRCIAGGGVAFTRTLSRPSDGRTFTVTETFTPASDSVRWEVEITDAGGPWSAPIQTVLRYPAGEKTRLWSAWADPRNGSLASVPREELIARGIVPRAKESGNWADPLVPIEPLDATLSYGAPPYTYEKPQLHIIPDHHDVFCLPLVSLMEPDADTAVSLVLCPEDLILDLTLTTGRDGTARFDRLFHRIGNGQTLRFRMDLVCHAADPRAAIGWMHRRYADFFLPPNPRAHDIAGTGSYSNATEFDEQKMRDMAYKVYWRASFDFPYMGMFLPPVAPNVQWNSFRNVMTSIDEMSRFSKSMRERGFHVLSYFNVTEFGTAVKFPPPESFDVPEDKLWTDANAFLYTKLRDAMLMVPEKQTSLLPRCKPGEPFWTWCAAVAMDPGEPVYRDFLLEQARRHIEMLPADDGLCIDRMDWLRIYNLDRDDGVSWFDDKPARSLRVSWRDLMDRLGPLMHAADKTIFCNNHDKRIEILRHADGIYDEFTNSGRSLNTIAMLGVTKPVMGWTNHADEMRPDADAFFQKYLYMGVFPMTPFPGNDHSIRPTPWVERQHLDYGPLMKLMRHKQWVLRPHCVETPDGNAKANLFRVADGFVVPVVYAGDATEVRVKLGRFAAVAQTRDLTIRAVQPGVKDPVEVDHRWVGDDLELTVPVHRGCAMVHLRIGS